MPYDGSGNFTIINNFEEDRINGVSIDSLKMDNNFEDIANGLSNVMLRSGSVVMTGILNMGDHKITNLVAGTSSKDAVNKEQMDTALSAKQATITGGASTITSSNLTASRALVSSSSGKVAVSAVTATELGYLSGVTSAIQTQINGKQATVTGGASTITGSNLTASRALVSNSSGKVAVSAVTSTELGYLDGVTSAIQTQLNGTVKTTGNQTIEGTKTFSSTISGSINGNAATVTNGVYTTGNQTIGGTKTFSAVAYGKASSAENSILTTVSCRKGTATGDNANGYFKLGNGMIIQWGNITSTSFQQLTVTLPIAFSNTNYRVVLTQERNNTDTYEANTYVRSKTTSSFNILGQQDSTSFIAIGY